MKYATIATVASIFLAGAANAVPVFEPKSGATFHKSPGGQQVPVPYRVLLVPIEGLDYNKGTNGWCKWKLVTPRGKSVMPSAAWVICASTGKSAGHI